MKYQKLEKKDYKISNWSGGETTEVFLYPPDGSYKIGSFDYRISTATVSLDESLFSSLSGYKRVIMPLDQPIELQHDNKKEVIKKRLKPFEVAAFSGDNQTKSIGKCQDFNLIYLPKYEGKMLARYSKEVTSIKRNVTYIYYALKSIELRIPCEKSIILLEGESVILTNVTDFYNLEIVENNKSNQPCVIEVSVL